ncbi:MAG: HAMP domain-containing sensor histidine kinase [Bacteriovorax sp.]|nr:HAMP domain-containing sensor histidine kinase [Bacteriovorax sp.]
MFLNKIKKIFRQVGVKMTLWHLGLLIISSCFLFLVFYFLYSQSLEDKDHQVLEAKFNEYHAIYRLGGVTALTEYVHSPEYPFKNINDFFIRIETNDQNTSFFHTQGQAAVFNLKEIEHGLYNLADKEKSREQWFYIKTKRSDDDLEVLSIKMPNGEHLQVGKAVDDRDDLLERFERTFAEVLLCALILGGIGGILLSNRILRPVRRLINTLNNINKGDEKARVPLSGNEDELQELSILFNQMLDRINISNQAMRQTLDTVAHELRTPLTSIRGLAEVNLQKKIIGDKDARVVMENCVEGIDEILSEFKMMTDITEVESGLQNLKKEEVSLQTICQDIIDLYEIVAEQKEIQIILDPSSQIDQFKVFVDRKKIRQALANLIDNAIKYSPEHTQIHLSYYKHNQQAVIRVCDQGIGINQEEIPHIWKRLYRGENSRSEKGIGLGLSLVKSIVEAHNGSVGVEMVEGGGSCFIIKLPS